MCDITTNFRLQLRIDMMQHQSFWYLSGVLLVFLVISCREIQCSLDFLFEMLVQHIS